MRVVALITEYNPFHNGHLHHINEAKRITDADFVVVVMSGNFVQRGAPAIIDKYSRTEMALEHGVDLVIELPTCYSVSSAEYYALGAVSILNRLGVVNYLCFGSEAGDIEVLKYIAGILSEEPEEYKIFLLDYIKSGMSFPVARTNALIDYYKIKGQYEYPFGDGYGDNSNKLMSVDYIKDVLSKPNNVLGIEYIKALNKLNSPIEPITIERIGANYHETALLDTSFNIASATAVREHITDNYDFHDIKPYVPPKTYGILTRNQNKTFPLQVNDISLLLYYKLLSETKESLIEYTDVDAPLANKIINSKEALTSFSEYVSLLKSKQLTYTRISRSLLHILLNIKKPDMSAYINSGITEYARILGFNLNSSQLIKAIKMSDGILLINKVPDAFEKLSPIGNNMLNSDVNATHLYNKIASVKYKTAIPDEFRRGIIIKQSPTNN